jgi:ribosomal protein L19E
MALFVAATLIATIPGPANDANAQSFFSSFWRKLDAHELGTWNYLEEAEATGIRAIRSLVIANYVTLIHAQRGLNHGHSDQLRAAQCKMVQAINGLYSWKRGARKLKYPDSLKWRQNHIRELSSFSEKLKGYRLCADIPQHIYSEMYRMVRRYYRDRKKYIENVENRSPRYHDKRWATAISAEIPGIPLKFEFLNGELKLKLSRSVGGVKFDGLIGPTSKKSGIKTVKILTQTEGIIYEIRNKPITFELPASIIKFNGDTATIIYR